VVFCKRDSGEAGTISQGAHEMKRGICSDNVPEIEVRTPVTKGEVSRELGGSPKSQGKGVSRNG